MMMKRFCLTGMRTAVLGMACGLTVNVQAQLNTERLMNIGRNALYYEDYVLSIQYFNQVAGAKPFLYEPYYFRAIAKYNLGDYLGAANDADMALQRNAYLFDMFQIEGLSYIFMNEYDKAVKTYLAALELDKNNEGMWNNLVLCYVEMKHMEQADTCVNQMVELWPRSAKVRTLQAQVALEQNDSLKAYKALDTAVELDPKNVDAWKMKGVMDLRAKRFAEAELCYNHALELKPAAALFINRALARFQQNNYRGAMADYDEAIRLEPRNFLGHFNRGLLRQEVGDDNKAIEDFNVVLELEPDNMIARFNRALLYHATGNHRAALTDITAVIQQYPYFWTGYQYRAEILRRLGDEKGAQRDEMRVMKARLDHLYSGKAVRGKNTRTQGDDDIEHYQDLVVAEDEPMDKNYTSNYRGKVQNKKVEPLPQPMFTLALYEQQDDVNRVLNYLEALTKLNEGGWMPQRVQMTAHERALSPTEMTQCEQRVTQRELQLAQPSQSEPSSKLAEQWLTAGIDHQALMDYKAAISCYDKAVELDENQVLAYFCRAVARLRQMEVNQGKTAHEKGADAAKDQWMTVGGLDLFAPVMADLQQCVKLVPRFAQAYYNMGCVWTMRHDDERAMACFTQAIECQDDLAEAYYNRGLIYRQRNEQKLAVDDFSKAGELGLYGAYNLIKQTSVKNSSASPKKSSSKKR